MPRPLRFVPALAALALVAASSQARAGLREDTARLTRALEHAGQSVEAAPTEFVEHGRARLVTIANEGVALGSIACVSAIVVGPRAAEFSLDVERPPAAMHDDRPRDDDQDARTKSAAGVAVLTRCGAERAGLTRVVIEMTTGRAALEILVVRGERPPPDLDELVPDRALGPVALRADAGGPIEPGPLAPRVARAMARAKAEGAAKITRTSRVANANGTGRFDLKLEGGCHRVEVFAEVPTKVPRRATDVDAEAHELETGRLLARDHADVPDARLDFCLGEAAHVQVPFLGASEAVEVALTDAIFPLPTRLPERFGARARAGLAWTLHKRHAPAPVDPPVATVIGAQGLTELSLEIEPGRCYLAAVAVRRGDTRALRLAVEVEERHAHDEVEAHHDAASVTFCSEAATRARAAVEVRGPSASWVLLAWPLGPAP